VKTPEEARRSSSSPAKVRALLSAGAPAAGASLRRSSVAMRTAQQIATCWSNRVPNRIAIDWVLALCTVVRRSLRREAQCISNYIFLRAADSRRTLQVRFDNARRPGGAHACRCERSVRREPPVSVAALVQPYPAPKAMAHLLPHIFALTPRCNCVRARSRSHEDAAER